MEKKLKLSQFGQKHRLMNSVMASFKTTMVQMTEMFPWPKYLSENDWNVPAKKKQIAPSCVEVL